MKGAEREAQRQVYRQTSISEKVFIPAKPKSDIFGKDRIFRVCAYCRVSTENDEQLSSFELQQAHYEQLGNNSSEISMDGFQLVPGQMFSRQLEPSMTIWFSYISFNTSCYSALNDCGCIQIMVNSKERKVIITPCPAKDKDAITWLKPTDKQKYKKIECSKFTHQLFDIWGLDKELHYRANGKLVTAGNRVMLLFDYSNPEEWRGLKMVNGFGK